MEKFEEQGELLYCATAQNKTKKLYILSYSFYNTSHQFHSLFLYLNLGKMGINLQKNFMIFDVNFFTKFVENNERERKKSLIAGTT